MRSIYSILLSLFIGCSSIGESEKLNAQSIAIHNAMVRRAGDIKNELRLLKSDSLLLVNKDSIDLLLFALDEWEQDVVEIPGNESHQHTEHSHHDHSNQAPEVTSLQMLQIQQELDKRLKTISRMSANLLNHSQKQLSN